MGENRQPHGRGGILGGRSPRNGSEDRRGLSANEEEGLPTSLQLDLYFCGDWWDFFVGGGVRVVKDVNSDKKKNGFESDNRLFYICKGTNFT